MKIHKILNNNAVIVQENQKEKVVMGRGIAFKAHVGDPIDETAIQKIFVLSQERDVDRTLDMLRSMPLEYLQITDQILKQANSVFQRDTDAIYISLSDHIRGVVERARDGVLLKNPLLPDIKRFYPKEYAFGMEATAQINNTFHVNLNVDEAAFIAMHLLANLEDGNQGDVYQMTDIIQGILHVVGRFYQRQFDEDSIHYYRFIVHLRIFSQRLLNHCTFDGDETDDLLLVVKRKYKRAYQCALEIRSYIESKFHQRISNDEVLYLAIHINRLNQPGK